jgi:hypothetical protein
MAAGLATSTAPAFAQRWHRDGFRDGDREVVRSYYTENYRDGCPPGFVRQGYDCLTPGQARRQYAIGRRLGRGVEIRRVPDGLAGRLGGAPRGYRYGVVDGDVVKYNAASRLVVDAIRALTR